MVEVVAIVVVSEHGPTIDASIRAVVGLKCDGFELVNADMFDAVVPPGPGDNHVLSDARSKAKNFLNGSKSVTKAILLTAPTLEDAARQLAEHGSSVRLGMCIIHCRTVSPAPHSPNCLNPYIEEFFARLETAGVPFLRSADSVVAIIPRSDYEALPYQGSIDYRLRVEPDEAWILDADLTVCIVNYLQHCYTSRFAHRRLQGRKQDVSLGLYLTELMQSRFGDNWLLSYYTGTIVSLLIKTLQGQADARGIRTIRGANEHSLACASFINWRL